MKKRLIVFFVLLAMGLMCVGGVFISKLYRYRADLWFGKYVLSLINGTNPVYSVDQIEHVLFMIGDHHEPGRKEAGLRRSRDWNEKYRQNIAGLQDDYGHAFQYSWFYPYDHKNSDVVMELNKLAFDDLGEVEFHWHHKHDTNETFQAKLDNAMNWFTTHGAMIHAGETLHRGFAFIHGNWALDNSIYPERCGVTRELDILKAAGCYVDMTFSTLNQAQPRMFSSMFYAQDTDAPKSYDTGSLMEVGKKQEGLLLVQTPSALDIWGREFEMGTVEDTSPIKKHRIKLWVENGTQVLGRPEWRFVKVYTHGIQSRSVILGGQFQLMIRWLKEYCAGRNFKLHFVTAREYYNIARAAEAGMTGDPEDYRDFEIGKPVNRLISIPYRVVFSNVSDHHLSFTALRNPTGGIFRFKITPIRTISGYLTHLEYTDGSEAGQADAQNTIGKSQLLRLEGTGELEVTSASPLKFDNQVIESEQSAGVYFYRVQAFPGQALVDE